MSLGAYRMTHFVWLLFAVISSASVRAQTCTLCQDGTPTPVPNATFGDDLTCGEIESFLAFTDSTDAVCIESQTAGFLACGCPSYPEDFFCPMCANSELEIANPLRRVLTMEEGTLCEDIRFVNSSIDGACEEIANAAYFCGCPNATRSDCFLCGHDASSPPSFGARRLPPTFQYTCDQYDLGGSLLTFETCGELTGDLPIDAVSYCGCPSATDPPATCSICGDVALINLDTEVMGYRQTCAEVDVMASFVTDADYCTKVQQDTLTTCCDIPDTLEPTSSPTVAPVGQENPTPRSTSATADHSMWASHAIAIGVVGLYWSW